MMTVPQSTTAVVTVTRIGRIGFRIRQTRRSGGRREMVDRSDR
jgi:hypothetical protein